MNFPNNNTPLHSSVVAPTSVLVVKCKSSKAEDCSDAFWTHLENVQGIEESPLDGSSLFRVDADFEILEFGSDAAKRCAEWLEKESYRGTGEMLLRIYVETFPDSALPEKIKAVARDSRDLFEFVSYSAVPDQNYLEEYKKSVRGSAVGDALWVGPPWVESSEFAGRIPFFVEPGLAFGTGDHPTTQLCLQRLYEWKLAGREFSRILDLGTGSGVLALAAREFFPNAQLVVSDLDPLCAEEVRKTFALNKTPLDRCTTLFGALGTAQSIAAQGMRFDLVISNIYAEILALCARAVNEMLVPRGLWLSSGILEGPSEKALLRASNEMFRCELRRSHLKRMMSLDSSQGLQDLSETWVLLEMSPKSSNGGV